LTSQDSAALRLIYQTNGGSSWSSAENWFVPNQRLTEWEGVKMTGTRISSLDLSNRGLTGKFPNAFQHTNALEELVTLNLQGNDLTDLGVVENFATLPTPTLTDLDIADNRLFFDDIEPLFNAGTARINSMTIHPQQPIGTLLYDTIPRGDNFFVTFNDIPADTYQWTRIASLDLDRNRMTIRDSDVHPGPGSDVGKPLYSGTETNSLEILDVNFESMGDISVDMTDSDIPGLVLQSQFHNVLAFGGIQLNVSDLNGLPLDEGSGYLLKIEQPGQPFDTIDVENFIDGDLFFDVTILGDYVIPVTADETIYLPTYYTQTFLWEEADTLEFRNIALVANMKMTPIPGPLNIADVGQIFGVLDVEFVDVTGRVEGRRRQKGTRCHVRRNTGGGRTEDSDTYVLIASVVTNDNGEFDLPNLPPGLYRINFEYPGVPMDPNSFVEFEVGDGADNATVQLDALVSLSGSILVEEIVPTGVNGELFTALDVYPNPVSSQLNVAYDNLTSSDVMVQLIDINGKVIIRNNLPRAENHVHQIDVSGLGDGLYFLTMIDTDSGELVKSFKLVLRK